VARRQFSDIVTFSVVYRTRDNVQRWQKLARFPILTPHLARQEAIRILRAKALGQDPAGERMALRSGPTIAELCDEYQKRDNGKKPGTIRSDSSRIKGQIKPRLGKLRVASVTSEQIDDFVRSLSIGSQARTIGLLGAIFSYAVKRNMRPDNPCRGIEKPKETKKTRRLSEAEYAQFGSALNGAIVSDIFLLLAVTGWRSSEAKNLRWSELDMERCIATLGDTKTGVSVRPLSGAAIDIIKRQKQNGSAYVFDRQVNGKSHGKPIDALRHQWLKLGMSAAVTPHTLRHSFASLAGDMGLSDSTIARLLGHSQSSITSRYIHMEKSVIEAINLVASETIRLMQKDLAH
jgi:integrase